VASANEFLLADPVLLDIASIRRLQGLEKFRSAGLKSSWSAGLKVTPDKGLGGVELLLSISSIQEALSDVLKCMPFAELQCGMRPCW
jgi:hypothetical protein